jgi:hypothetical protein
MCLTALKDLEKSSVDAIMELAFPSSRNPIAYPAYTQTISRSRSLPSMSQSPESTNRPMNRSTSGDAGPHHGMDISALARSEIYSDILDAEEEALGLSPQGGGLVQVQSPLFTVDSTSTVTFQCPQTEDSQ